MTTIDLLILAMLVISLLMCGILFFQHIHHKKRKRQLFLSPQKDDIQNIRIEDEVVEVSVESPLQNPTDEFHRAHLNSLGFNDVLTEPLTIEGKTHPEPVRFDQLVVLHVMALPDKKFIGYELLQALLSAGLRHGEMNIFHRYLSHHGQLQPLFSLASATEPGSFDLDNMGAFSCHGLSLFMNFAHLKDPISAFNLMVDTAQQLADELGGVVQDENRCELTPAILEKYRYRMRAATLKTV